MIMTTHKYFDFSGANLSLQHHHPKAQIIGGVGDFIPGATKTVKDGERFRILGGSIIVKCYHTPCEKDGHVMYYMEADGCSDGDEHETQMKREVKQRGYMSVVNINRCIFTGDAVTAGGCGSYFNGGAASMIKAMDVMLSLPDDTKLFPGHEYTESNFIFNKKVEPNNAKVDEFWEKYKKLLDNAGFNLPTVLRDEKLYNVFLRFRTEELHEAIGNKDPVKAMDNLRYWKNRKEIPDDVRKYHQHLEMVPIKAAVQEMKKGRKMIVVHVNSAGFDGLDKAEIFVNDRPVKMGKNESGHYRGLHIVVLNPKTGNCEMAMAFDTYKSSKRLDEFVDHGVNDDFMVIAACKDDCATNLSDKAKKWFSDMGSVEINNVQYRKGFVFAGVVGKTEDISERRAEHSVTTVSISHIWFVKPSFKAAPLPDAEILNQ